MKNIKVWIDMRVREFNNYKNKAFNKNFNDDNIIIVPKVEKTEIKNYIEHIRKEIDKLKKGIIEIESDIVDIRIKEFKIPSIFTIYVLIGSFLIIMAFCMTVKRILRKKLKEIEV